MSKKILVVDDEADIRTFLKAVLKKEGFDTIEASDGQQALETVKREKPDAIILDLQMPNQTGTDFYRKLSKDSDLKKIPIIVVSGLAGRNLALRKPAAVFDKPIDPAKFIAALNKALEETS